MKLIGCVPKGSAAAASPCTAALSLPRPTWSLSSHDRCNVPLAALRAPDDRIQPVIRRHAVLPLHALAESQSVETVDASGSAPAKPSAAETARTVLDIAAHGTLATTNADGKPLGTYVLYSPPVMPIVAHPCADTPFQASYVCTPRLSNILPSVGIANTSHHSNNAVYNGEHASGKFRVPCLVPVVISTILRSFTRTRVAGMQAMYSTDRASRFYD
jgi:hypothetical protein